MEYVNELRELVNHLMNRNKLSDEEIAKFFLLIGSLSFEISSLEEIKEKYYKE